MAYEALATLLAFLEVFRPALSQPSFGRMRVVFSGWVLTSGVHAVTSALVAAAIPGRKHHEAFHRFFSRGTWDPDRLGWFLFECALKLAGGRIQVALDDTLAPKKGPHVFGIGSHLDAVRSTRRFRVFCFGHCWVVLAVLVPVPFARRMWALPVLFRLYRTVKECETKGHVHRKKTELAREMLDVLVGWAGEREVEVSADSAYCNDTITRGLSPRVVLFGAMRPDAVLTAAPAVQPRRGRRRKRGRVLAKPEARACDGRYGWQICEAVLYGRKTKVRYKTYCAQWYRACGERLLRIVVVRMATGAVRHRVFFSTDPSLSAPQVLETYAGRWAIEVCFRDLSKRWASPTPPPASRLPSNARRRSSASSTPRSCSGSPSAFTAPRSQWVLSGPGTATSAAPPSPTSCAPRNVRSRRSTFWIHVAVSTTYANLLRRRPCASGGPSNGPRRGRNTSLRAGHVRKGRPGTWEASPPPSRTELPSRAKSKAEQGRRGVGVPQ